MDEVKSDYHFLERPSALCHEDFLAHCCHGRNVGSPMLGRVSVLELGKCLLTHCFPKHTPEARFAFCGGGGGLPFSLFSLPSG